MRIKELRQAAGMTQAELAEKIGVSLQAISHYEHERRQIKVSMLMPLADALGCKLEDLFDETETND